MGGRGKVWQGRGSERRGTWSWVGVGIVVVVVVVVVEENKTVGRGGRQTGSGQTERQKDRKTDNHHYPSKTGIEAY